MELNRVTECCAEGDVIRVGKSVVIAGGGDAPARFAYSTCDIDAVAGECVEVIERPFRAVQRFASVVGFTERFFSGGGGLQAPCGGG